ncbi:hypothetical protein B0T22DRAFT_467399 [Podospora appendiculata]|uniref:Rhodopsin domain-containing protein n=1 Tax=Podospora appendiculata TaxID=314037 RepID=A0AAE1CB31_9PEZI|nr:hypothetical protein B0T22DRAFT_467399 [Podospora appendiculata]
MATLYDIPAMAPPPGSESNFVDPETMHPVVLGVAIATMTLVVMTVGIRVFVKGFVLRDLRLEDYFAILAAAGIIVWDSIFVSVSMNGFSRHLWDVRFVDVRHMSFMNYLAEISNALTMFAAKASILFQLKRLFCTGQSRDSVFWSIQLLLFLNAAYYTSAMFTFIFQCAPREKAWDMLMEGQCINVAAATVVAGAVNVFLDVGILVVPIWAILHLQLPLKRKLGISAVFGVGILTCAIAAVGVALRIPLLTDQDLTWLITKVGIWTMVEYFGTILVGCMPTFPLFFLYIRGQYSPTSSNSRAKSNKSSEHSNPTRVNTYHLATRASTNENRTAGVGVAVTTSEESFTDPSYIRLEDGGHRHMRSLDHNDRDGQRWVEPDWSPLSGTK